MGLAIDGGQSAVQMAVIGMSPQLRRIGGIITWDGSQRLRESA